MGPMLVTPPSLMSASPLQNVLDGPNARNIPQFDECTPHFVFLADFFLKHLKFTDYRATSVKHLKSVSQSPHIDKQYSLDEIRI